MTNFNHYSILKGYQMDAVYSEQIVPEYVGNPFIEAIPPRLSMDELYDRLYSTPKFRGDLTKLGVEDRLELIQQIKPSYWLPISSHFDKYRIVYNMLKIGYQSRNPTTAIYQRQRAVGYGKILNHGTNPDGTNLVGHMQTAQQCAEIGLSGMGKSKTYEKILQLFPQVIEHGWYHEKPLPTKQVVWLKIECPANRSVGALCRNFYYAVDQILGTTYYNDIAEKDGRAEVLAKRIATVAGLIDLGVLVIDEIQRINRAHSGGDKQMIDFITELTNSIGIPIIMIGTFKASYLFKKCLANCRRGVPDGYAENITDRMKDDWEWEQFIENLWDLQYTRTHNKLTTELKAAMYYHTIGIPDFAVKLFMHVQSHAILYSDDEIIDVQLLNEVANKTFRMVQPIFNLIREGKEYDVEEFDDLTPDWIAFDKYLSEAGHKVTIEGKMSDEHKRIFAQRNKKILIEQLTNFAIKMGCLADQAERYAEEVGREHNEQEDTEFLYSEIAKRILSKDHNVTIKQDVEKTLHQKKSGRKKKLPFEEGDIRQIVATGVERGLTTDEALIHAGLTSAYDEFLAL